MRDRQVARQGAKRRISHCHVKLKGIAQELAAVTYERLMSFDPVYKKWKDGNPGLEGIPLRERFVAKYWGRHVAAARATLAMQLRDPTIDEKVKEEIMEVLALDSTLIRGRVAPAVLAGTVSQKG